MLQNMEFFSCGTFPPSYNETGYIGKSSTRGHNAPFENPVMLWGELQVRIAHCGQDGYLMENIYSQENQLAETDKIARAFHMDINEVSARCERVLKYVTGICRRWIPCRHCRVKDCTKRGKKKAYEYQSYRY
uniref:Uncharacterized protein n=2 Tax=viral metagenome TaxID=1070528 RepID=A0A6M3IQM7_9ZZZZ